MDIFFQDPGETPLPPDQVRIREFRPTPWPDGRRVRVYLEVDPFQKRPNAEVVILDRLGQVAAEVSLIESISRKMEFNMHLRPPEPAGDYEIKVILYYQSLPDESDPESQSPSTGSAERMVVDTAQAVFTIPSQ